MRVLITGGLGFIGSTIAERYVTAGAEVLIVDDRRANVVERVEGVHIHHFAPVQESLMRLTIYPPDLVVHCASPVGAVGILSEAGRIATEIVSATEAVIDACAIWECPLVNVSTSEVYGFSGTYSEHDGIRVPARYTARLEYAVGKLAAEYAVANSAGRGLRAVTVRPFNVVGPRQPSTKGFVLPTFIEQAMAGKPITVYDTGMQERAFTAVEDVAAFVELAGRELMKGHVLLGAWNVGNPANRTSISALAERVKFVTDSPSPIVHTDGKTEHGEEYEEAEGFVKLPSIRRAQSLGWEPKVGLAEIVQWSVAHYRREVAA